MKKWLLILVLSAGLALSACTTTPPPSASSQASSSSSQQLSQPVDIPFSLAAYPAFSFHPVLAENRANLTLAPLLYEPLFQLDENFQPEPVLCQTYSTSADGLSWIFSLRSGISFSDGTPLSGQLVAEALNVARQPDSRYATRLADITAISGDETTITITLSRPNGNLPALLDIPIAYGIGERPAGTGPYILSGDEQTLVLKARSNWWQDTPLPAQEIPLTAVEQSDALISAFSSGEVALVDTDLMGTNALGYSGSYETWDYATTDFLYLGFNTQSGPCRTAQVRQALAQSIDRESIVQVDFARHAVATTLPVHPDCPLYIDQLSQALSYRPEELELQRSDLRLPNRPLELLVNSENTAKVAVAQRIAYQLEAAGIEIQLKKLPFDDYTHALEQGDFDLYLGEVVLTADFDLSILLHSSGTLNYGRWRDSTTDTLLTAFRSAQAEARNETASTLFTHLNEQVPIAPICFKNGSVLTQWGRLSGLSPVRGNVFYHLEGWTIR
ncbi:MAG: ABC transporter substrate-binding protein [Lawsonibacter sp.]|jgi:peptide/nickel transport system substrate-binding protein